MSEELFKEKALQILEDIDIFNICKMYKYKLNGIKLDSDSKSIGLFFEQKQLDTIRRPYYTFILTDNKEDIIEGIKLQLSGKEENYE